MVHCIYGDHPMYLNLGNINIDIDTAHCPAYLQSHIKWFPRMKFTSRHHRRRHHSLLDLHRFSVQIREASTSCRLLWILSTGAVRRNVRFPSNERPLGNCSARELVHMSTPTKRRTLLVTDQPWRAPSAVTTWGERMQRTCLPPYLAAASFSQPMK